MTADRPQRHAAESLRFAELVRPGDMVVGGQGGAEPLTLTEALMAQRHEIGRFRAGIGLSLSATPSPDHADCVTFEPLRPAPGAEVDTLEPGRIIAAEGEIELNAGRRKATVTVVNTGDRPVQIGSHYHFFEANKALEFDREAAFGMRLDIPAGTAVRLEPGQEKEVTLTTFGGRQVMGGLNGLTSGAAKDATVKKAALKRAKAAGFRGA